MNTRREAGAEEAVRPGRQRPGRFAVEEIRKGFPGVQALAGVSITFQGGEVHALVGENGAGKSTLVKIIGGVYPRDGGTLSIDGRPVEIGDPRAAAQAGISVIHQEFSLFPELNVTQNLFIGMEETRLGGMVLDKREMESRARGILGRLNLSVAMNLPVRFFSVAEQQLMEIAKCLLRDSWLIIMDEPTSALSRSEKEALFRIIRDMKREGLTIVYISHHLEEIAEIADRVSILRDGKLVGTWPVGGIGQSEITSLMVGKEIGRVFHRSRREPGEPVLEVRGLSKTDRFEQVSFAVRKGEVLGLSGLLGFGHTDVCAVLFGLEGHDAGQILLDGRPAAFSQPLEAMRRGVMYVPEDRKRQGIVPLMNAEENLSLMSLHWISRLGWIDGRSQRRVGDEMVRRLGIKVSSPYQKVDNLSGGNQQKVVIGKCLTRSPRLLILNDPTRGIDVGAKEEIYRIIDRLAGEGVAIIMTSSEIPEYVGLCDRVLVFRQGRIVREFRHGGFDQREILAAMLGTRVGAQGGEGD